MGTVFSLTATIFQQPIAEVSHVIGRLPAFMLVLFVFFTGSVVAARASDMTMLLIGRGVQGIASGGSVLIALVLTDMIELRDRATWLSVQNAIQALGLRWLFWINLPPIAIAAVALVLLLGFERPKDGMIQALKKVDWVGIFIFMPSTVAILVPFTMGGILFPWSSWRAIVPLVLGVGGLVLLGVHQRYVAKYPMFRISLFEKWVTVFAFMGQAVFGLCVNMIFYYLVVYWSGIRGFDEILTGVALLPETFSIPIAAIVCGLLMRQTGNIRGAMLIGWPLTSLSIGLLWFLDSKTPLAVLVVINVGVGLGAGTIASALNVALLASTKKEDNGHAMAMGFLCKSAGMCFGIAIGTAVFTVEMRHELEKMGGADVTAESFLRALREVKGDERGRMVIVHALRILWMICCGLSGLVGLLCCACPYPPFHKRDITLESDTSIVSVRESKDRLDLSGINTPPSHTK
ncbi:major facilitator superfamily domain-containing protein [Echria macrotheca]|uniref:Major facilitator superfamily domain-containing protein n=1 Tax=Echria macrotheca TaxID=438768 RepID=A0AAJ0FF62_9PEZI|nr:major facilitator superfamily domain-containing protein [Echria macrotheca]